MLDFLVFLEGLTKSWTVVMAVWGFVIGILLHRVIMGPVRRYFRNRKTQRFWDCEDEWCGICPRLHFCEMGVRDESLARPMVFDLYQRLLAAGIEDGRARHLLQAARTEIRTTGRIMDDGRLMVDGFGWVHQIIILCARMQSRNRLEPPKNEQAPEPKPVEKRRRTIRTC